MYVAVVDVDEPAVVPVGGQRVDIDQLRVEVAQQQRLVLWCQFFVSFSAAAACCLSRSLSAAS